ncbi:DUF4367 domain-containing protein [Paenibacillus sp. CC-CFT747]|nr:DUF4367 domain-containing protein [Paenibacillus sp. CC-CFT747]
MNGPGRERTAGGQVSLAVRRIHHGLAVPDGEEAWVRMQERLARERRGSRLRPVFSQALAAASLAALLIGAAAGSFALGPAAAETFWFHVGRKVQDGAVHLWYGRDGDRETARAKTAAPPAQGEGEAASTGAGQPAVQRSVVPARPVEMSVPEAVERWKLPAPARLPEGFAPDTAQLTPDGEEGLKQALLLYRNGDRAVLFLYTRTASGQPEGVYSFGGKAQAREIEINGSPGTLLPGDGYVTVQWPSAYAVLQVSGPLTEEEAVEVARSVR